LQQKRDIGYFDSLKPNARNITDSVTFVAKSINQNLIILLGKIQTTILGYKVCDFFAVLDQLDPDMFPDGRMWLLGFKRCFSQHNSLCCAQRDLLVPFIVPLLISQAMELPGSMKTRTIAHPAGTTGLSESDHTLPFLSQIWSILLPDCPRND
uniref:Uncharacterized protein n=1 Tax=Neovison vison TaxID=452646 RepID=A0A8C7A9K8_NEOVI